MSESEVTVTFDNWSGGNWGAYGAYNGGKMDPPKYQAVNLQMYKNGTLGPRPGWKRLGSLARTQGSTAIEYDLEGFDWVPGVPGGPVSDEVDGFLLVNHEDGDMIIEVKTATSGTSIVLDGHPGLAPHLGELSASRKNVAWHSSNQIVYGADDIFESLSTASTTGTAITWPTNFSPGQVVFHRDRAYAIGDSWNASATSWPDRIHYSDPGDITTWGATSFLDVGVGGTFGNTRPVVGSMFSLKNGLLFYTSSLPVVSNESRGNWYILGGQNPVVGNLSTLEQDTRVPHYWHSGVLFKDLVFWLDKFGRGITFHDGSKVRTDFDYIRPFNTALRPNGEVVDLHNAVSLPSVDALFLPFGIQGTVEHESNYEWVTGLQAFELVNGVWTRSQIRDPWLDDVDSTNSGKPAYTRILHDKIALATEDQEDGADVRFFTRDITLDRPANSSDTYSAETEAYAGSGGQSPFAVLQLPEVEPPDGHPARLRQIIVDIDYWNASGFSTPDIDSIKAIYRSRGKTPDTTEKTVEVLSSGEFDDATAWDTTDTDWTPKTTRLVYHTSGDVAGTVQVQFEKIESIAFRAVHLVFAIDKDRPVR